MIFLFLILSESVRINYLPETKTPPSARSNSLLCFLKARSSLVIFGGWNSEKVYNDIWEFSLLSLSWENIIPVSENLPSNPHSEPRHKAGGLASSNNQKFYIFGGRTSSGPENDFWVFDFICLKWEMLQTDSTPSPRSGFAFTSYEEGKNDYLVIQGGLTLNGLVNELYRLDLGKLEWIILPESGEKPEPSKESVLVHHDEYLLLTAGMLKNETECLSYLYRYSLSELTWSVISDKRSTFKCRYLAKGFVHDEKLFIPFGWLSSINAKAVDMVKFDLKSKEKYWEEVEIMSELAADEYSLTRTEDSVYFFGGYNHFLESVTNKLDKIHLKRFELVPMTGNLVFPNKRSMHSMSVINSRFYVFGGVDSQEVFNDLWRFDVEHSQWEQVPAKGSFPTGRYSHAAGEEGDAFVIWGGQNLNGLMNDLFIFNTITETWTELKEASSSKPKPAKGACLVLKNYQIYLYGGKTDSNISNELWEFNMGDSRYKLISSNCPVSVSFAHCWLEFELFYVSLGSKRDEAPSAQIVYFNFSSSFWETFHSHVMNVHDSAQSVQIFIDGKLISVGGQSWMQDAVKSISILGPENLETTVLFELDVPIYGSASVYYNRSLYIFGGGRVLGGSLLPNIGHNLFLELELKEICKDGKCSVLCSSGTRFSGTACEICKKGTFAEGFENLKCIPCPVGSFNQNFGSSSSKQCLPCPEGQYNNKTGASACKVCPVDQYCPIGSTSFSVRTSQETTESIQPPLYEDPNLRETLIIYQTLASVPLFLLFIILLSFRNLRAKLFKIDIFDHNHENLESKYLIKKKTTIGACFSILFVIGALLITCSSVVFFFKANVHESKGLVTLAVLESEVKNLSAEDFSVQITLDSFGGACEFNSKCINSMKIIDNFISYSKKSIICKMLENRSCKISIIYSKAIIKTGYKISLSITEKSSFSSGIEVNVTSSSSIPNQISSVFSRITSDIDSIFIGAVPSDFFFLATPSLFKSESDLWESEVTGYHISERSSPKPGSQFKTQDIPAVSYLNLNIFIERNSAGLLTKRMLKQNYMFFIGSLLGTVSGLFSATGFVMRLFERLFNKFIKKKLINQVQNQEISVPKSASNIKIADNVDSPIIHTNSEQDS